jgi:hypothetical protein
MANERCPNITFLVAKTLNLPNHLATKMTLERNYTRDMVFRSDSASPAQEGGDSLHASSTPKDESKAAGLRSAGGFAV